MYELRLIDKCIGINEYEMYQNNISSNKLLSKHGSLVKTYKRNDNNISNRYKITL